jgi:hypothetical protein
MRLFTNPSPLPPSLDKRRGSRKKRGASPLLDTPEKERCKIFKSGFTSVKKGSKEREGFAPLKNSSLSHYKGERDTG